MLRVLVGAVRRILLTSSNLCCGPELADPELAPDRDGEDNDPDSTDHVDKSPSISAVIGALGQFGQE